MSHLKLGLLIAAGIFSLIMGAALYYYKNEAEKIPALEQSIKDRDATIAQERENTRIANEASKSRKAEVDRLRALPPSVRTVRVFVPTSSPGVLVPSSTPGPDGACPTGGELPTGAGFDIGPSLYSEARRADELAAQLRALQKWVNDHAMRNEES